MPLEKHLKNSGQEIALPIEACVMMLLTSGMQEEVGATHCFPLFFFCQDLLAYSSAYFLHARGSSGWQLGLPC